MNGSAGLRAINRVYPDPVRDATDAQLLDWYAVPAREQPWVRFNFVASLDGAATHEGRAGGLGDAVDQHVFMLLRRQADVILVGAGTVRAEGYAGPLLSEADCRWRLANGLPAHPGIAVVSGSLDLDPDGAFFAQAPVRPLLLTTARADAGRRRALAPVADIVDAGTESAEPALMVAALAARGHRSIHSEGGPVLFGAFQAAGLVDELCLTVSPVLAGGTGKRIADAVTEHPLQQLELVHILESGGMLLLRYIKAGRRA
ncbi:pyrimidine reductase family protein [Arthrobacter sp. I2-34]|uniref:Pyrimidine reductase family protein n=1 Tax=Arthrobacter hankyongi TaxID=2904801 RepID=A0ABS9L7U8_9MICC|nr:pyrimidine reductase family protein [Arthrobacter hankyongi]MCG2622751.1 pyrimidine reductase family protein [Arthrobacter hankyongi]